MSVTDSDISGKSRGMETFSGLDVQVDNIDYTSLSLDDIAHSLSLQCRFGGHTKFHYSVAQHSLSVAFELKARGYHTRIQLYGLLHDASEAYLVDIPRPVKVLMPQYYEVEDKVMNAIWSYFGLPVPTKEEWDIVMSVDNDMLVCEGKGLMPCKIWLTDITESEALKPMKSLIILGRSLPESVESNFKSVARELLNTYIYGGIK